MATLVTRTTDQPDGTTAKGSELTHAEVDANFINLNSDKVEVSGAIVFAAKAGEALTKGDVVYVSGVSGNEPVVSKADADDASKMPAFGLAEADANNNAAVNVVTFGTLYDLDTSSFTAGDTVYVSTTAGSLTATKPAGESSLIQNIGKVIRSHASAGSIKVGGAGRSNDTPNLNDGNVFIGNSSNQTEARSLTGDDISGGTITSFASTGIDDNATSTAITIDSSENVGIGTGATVGGQLHVKESASSNTASASAQNLVLESNDTNFGMTLLAGSSTNSANIFFGNESDNDIGYIQYKHSDGSVRFGVNAAERMRIDSSGNVGIGTNSPSTSLHIAHDASVVDALRLENTNTGGETWTIGDGANNANGLTFYNANDGSVMTVARGGNVGIGTTSPSTKLQVNGTSRVSDGTTNIDAVSASGVGYFGTQTNHPLSLRTNDVVRATINADGTVDFTSDVFTTGDFVAGKNSGSIALTINDGYGNSNLTFNHQNGTPDQNGNAFRIEANTDSTSNGYMNFEGKSNVTGSAAVTLNDMARMYADSGDFHANGNVIAYSTTISDVRLKENVEQVTGALDILDQIRGVTFDRTDTGKKSAGVIAQELEQVMPYAIYESALPLKTGSEDDLYKLVEYDALHAVLIEAIKELRAEVEELRASRN